MTHTAPKAPRAVRDPETKKYVATCPQCGNQFTRSSRESTLEVVT